MKKCVCGTGTAWFGNLCHECRDAAIRQVTYERRYKHKVDPDTHNSTDHRNFRTPMTQSAIERYGKCEDESNP